MVSVLGIVLIGVLLKGCVFPPAATIPTATTTTASAGSNSRGAVGANPKAPTKLNIVDIDIDALLAGVEEVDFDYESAKVARPPMMPLAGRVLGNVVRPQQPIIDKVVTGIVWGPLNPVAIIDGLVVGVGYIYPKKDERDPLTQVLSIERNRVWFKIGQAELPVDITKEL